MPRKDGPKNTSVQEIGGSRVHDKKNSNKLDFVIKRKVIDNRVNDWNSLNNSETSDKPPCNGVVDVLSIVSCISAESQVRKIHDANEPANRFRDPTKHVFLKVMKPGKELEWSFFSSFALSV